MGLGRRYQIHEAVGRGAFGTVYRAVLAGEGGFQKEVAVKILNDKAAVTDGVVERLRDEARMLGRVRHRAILQVDGLVYLDGRWALITEFVSGCSLLDVLRTGPMPVGAAMEMVSEIASALHVAYHTVSAEGQPLRLVHRDIKPANIQVTTVGEVKLLDFGIARAEFDAREAETQSLVLGTPGYMAPERFEGSTGPESDVYALAIVLCEVVSGARIGRTSIYEAQHVAHITKGLDDTLTVNPDFAAVRAFCEQMMAYNPNDRPTAKDVERQMRALRAGLPGPWLSEWADATLPAVSLGRKAVGDQTLTGQSLIESAPGTTPGPAPVVVESPPPPNGASVRESPVSRPAALALVGVGAVLLVAVVVAAGVLVGDVLRPSAPADVPAAPTVAPPVVAVVPLPPEVVLAAPPVAPDPPPTEIAITPVALPPKPLPVPVAAPPSAPPLKEAGLLVSASDFAAWLSAHPEWLPETARAEGRADENYLWGWTGSTPPDPGAAAVAVPYGAAEAMCRAHGGLAAVDAAPTAWDDTSGRMQEWRTDDGKPSWLRNDGKKSNAVRRAESNIFTGFRCAR